MSQFVDLSANARAGANVNVSHGFPRAPLVAIGSLVVLSVIAVTAVRLTGVGVVHVVEAPAVQVRDFRFEDRPDGSIVVFDAASMTLVDTVPPESNGFIRGTMRGLARERHRQGIGADLPFRMTGHADGHLTLDDPGTGRHVDLGSFGPTNAAAFAQIMASHDSASRVTTPKDAS